MTGDLFGHVEKPAPPKGDVTITAALKLERGDGWMLDPGAGKRAQWVPKSQVTRGEGRDEGQWTMPGWLAADRGWL